MKKVIDISDDFPMRNSNGFTLIEMLVAMSVLILLVAMIGQVVSLSSRAINANSKRLDGAEQARLALDQIGTDLVARPNRKDIPFSFVKQPGNDSLAFYSGVPGYSGARRVAAVEYRIQETKANRLFQLERGALGTDWSGGTPLYFAPQTFPSIPDDDYEVLAESVFRIEFCFLRTDGTFSTTAASDLSNVSAIVVGLATLDPISRKMITPSQLQSLSDAFSDSVDGTDVTTAWYTTLNTAGGISDIPLQVIQAIHIYQRQYNVP